MPDVICHPESETEKRIGIEVLHPYAKYEKSTGTVFEKINNFLEKMCPRRAKKGTHNASVDMGHSPLDIGSFYHTKNKRNQIAGADFEEIDQVHLHTY